MARTTEKLSPAKVRTVKAPGLYGDGAGLYLNVGPTGGKSWLFRYMIDGRARYMGLGPLHTIGLAEARDRARAARQLKLDGTDPLEVKANDKTRRKAEAAAAITFKATAEKYVKAHRAGWRNEKHAWQWSQTLEAYAYPVIGDLAVGAVDTGHVTRILEPIWATKAETAARVRGRIEAVLDYARTHGWRTGENPARWRGHLENVLPARSRVAKVQHHAALPWAEVGAFMADLERQDGIAARALRFTILTAARTGEVIGARWTEIDMREAVWTVPGERMKAGVEHRVPLSGAAMDVLDRARELGGGSEFMFPGGRAGRPLSNMAMLTLLRRMGRSDITTHGFRSAFSDWAAETTHHQREVVEAALAHTIESKVEAAYRRGDLFEKRRRLMKDWAGYSERPTESAVLVSSVRER